MIQVDQIDTKNKKQVKEFVEFHYKLYKSCPQWVPPFYDDIKMMLDRVKHPFYEHSDADFFVARENGEIVGRLAIMENRPFNKHHQTKKAQYYLFDSNDNQEIPNLLFERAFDWCRKRGLEEVVGPKGFNAFDGYGIQIEGFEHRQMMNMMNYNYAYYPKLFDNMGFEKEVDFVSCYGKISEFRLPERAHEIARRIKEKGTFKVEPFRSKNDLKAWADRIGEAYNKAFVNNWEYYPLSKREVKKLLDDLMLVADPKLIKIVTYKDEVVGFGLGFPDISAAMQRHGGKITPWGVADLLIELKRTKWVSFNGIGMLPEYQGRGGNALMFADMDETLENYKFDHFELTQVAETAVQMRKDLVNLGGVPYKNHRIYHKKI